MARRSSPDQVRVSRRRQVETHSRFASGGRRRSAHRWPVDGRWRCVPRALGQRVADQYPIAPEVLALLQPDPCASAFLTSDCEMPNCLAIADGLTPALKAARTALSLPVVNEPAPSSAVALRRCSFASASGFSFSGLRGSRPRRSASTVTAVSSSSISTSSNRFSAPAKSVGKKWRCCEARLPADGSPRHSWQGYISLVVFENEPRSDRTLGSISFVAKSAECRSRPSQLTFKFAASITFDFRWKMAAERSPCTSQLVC